MSAWLRKQLVRATVFSTPYMPDRTRRLAGPYRWQASSHLDLCSPQCRHGCASSLWEQLSFLFRTCPTAYGGWQGPIAGKPAPTQTSEVSMSVWLRKQLVGATFFSTRYMPDRMRRLAGPYRWQASSHPDLRSRQCRQGCVSSLWEQPSFLLGIYPTACGAWQGPIAGKPAPTQTSAAVNVGMAAQAACGSNCLFYSVPARSHTAPGRGLSLASQLPPRLLQPSMSAWLRKQLVGATVFSTPYMPDRTRRLAGLYRWQASSHPDLCSRQYRHGCASSLWERACPR
jgi:hypothetical protein